MGFLDSPDKQNPTEEKRILMDIIKSIIVWLIGLCYIAVTFPLNFIIWLLVFPFDRGRVIIHWFLMYQSLFLSFLIPIWTINIEGREKAVKGTTYVIISNHQSILDILLINCLRYKFKWISKIENINIPVLGWYLRMADYIIVDRGNEESKTEMLEMSYNCLKKGISIMIFPEGTRSLNNEIGFFKRGAFQLILPKHGLIFSSGHHIRIKVLDPIYPASFGTDTPENLAQQLSLLMTSGLSELRAQNNP